MDFIAVDVETTGTLSHVDHIVEIAGVKFCEGKVVGEFSSLINPGCTMPKEASNVNGITDDMLCDKPTIEKVLPSFSAFCGSQVLVAHNALFDFQFLALGMERHQCAGPQGPMLDTYSLSKTILPGMSNYKLSTLAEYFKITSSGFHRAKHDAFACGKLFHILLSHIKQKGYELSVKKVLELSGKKELRFPPLKANQLPLF